jgi:hypothetical protein
MAKKSSAGGASGALYIDKLLIIGLLLLSLSYIVRDSWAGAFAQAGAIVVGVLWSYRAATTHPNKIFRLATAFILALITLLLAFYLGDGVHNQL